MIALDPIGKALQAINGAKAHTAAEGASTVISRIRASTVPARGSAELLDAYRTTPILRSVQYRISTSIASTPWHLFRKPRAGSQRAMRELMAAPIEKKARLCRKLLETGDLEEVERHEILDILKRPNPQMTGRQHDQLIQTWIDLIGESFDIVIRNRQGDPSQLWPATPTWVTLAPGATPLEGGWRVNGTIQMNVPHDDMMVIKDLDVLDPYGRGSGFGHSLGHEIDTDEAASTAAAARFNNGGAPEVIISFPEATGSDGPELDRFAQDFRNRHQGASRAGTSAWILPFKPELTELGYSFADLQMVELRQFERDIMIQTYGVPPEILGIVENSNRATIEAASFLFGKYVLAPRLELLRSERQIRLVEELFGADDLVIWYDSPIPEDREFNLKAMEAHPAAYTEDEWREVTDTPPLPGGQGETRLVPLNLAPVPVREEEPEPEPEEDRRLRLIDGQKQEGTDARVDRVVRALRAADMTVPAVELWTVELRAWILRAAGELGVGVNDDVLNPLVTEIVDQFGGDLIVQVTGSTKEKIRATLIKGVRAGESSLLLGDRVRVVFQESEEVRSLRIARTEVIRASNQGNLVAMKVSGLIEMKEWVSTLDDRIRDSHRPMDGQIQDLNAPFILVSGDNLGATAQSPLQFGIPEEDINCRCIVAPVVTDLETGEPEVRSQEAKAAYWKQFDEDAAEWEERAVRVFRAAFKTQERSVLAELRDVFGAAA